MAKASDNKFPKVIITEGSAPSNADSGDQKLYIDSSDHHIKLKNSSGSVTDLQATQVGNVAADTIWDAKGDLVAGTGADTAAKLTVGTNGYHLEAQSGETTGLKWVAGGRVLIGTSSPTGTGTLSFSSIPATYSRLILIFSARGTTVAATVTAALRFNADTTATNYRRIGYSAYGVGSPATFGSFGANDNNVLDMAGDSGTTNSFRIGIIEIPFYANTGFLKQALISSSYLWDESSVYNHMENVDVVWKNTAAINQIDLVLASGNYKSGSIFNLYGEY